MTLNKLHTIQLLRNSTLYESRAAAIAALESLATNLDDGSPVVARYTVNSTKYCVLGIKTVDRVVVFPNDYDISQISAVVSNLDLSEVYTAGKPIIKVSQTDGQVSATSGNINAQYVEVQNSGNGDHFTSQTTVAAALEALYTDSQGKAVTITEGGPAGDVLKSYTVAQGGTTIGTINIPKDLVVTSGSVVKGTWSGSTFTENSSGSGTALKLVIANQTNPVYINTLDLVKDHTAGNGINISNTNEVSIKLDSTSEAYLTVGSGGLKLSGVASAISAATTPITVSNADGSIIVTASSSGTDIKVGTIDCGTYTTT